MEIQLNKTSLKLYSLLFLLFSCLAALLLAPLYSNTQLPNLLDYYNHLASIMQAKVALSEGQFPLRIAPAEHDGWRYPLFQFYSSTSYTFAAFIYKWLTPSNPYIAFKLAIACAFIFAGFYMQRLAYWLTASRTASVLASVVYITTPYHFIVINHMAAFNEAIALGILPAALFYTLKCYSKHFSMTDCFLGGIMWSLLATTHFITFFYTSIFVGLLLLFATLKNWQQWKNLFFASLCYGCGVLLALWYLVPVTIFGKYFNITSSFDFIDFFSSYLSITHLLSPLANIYGGYVDSNGYISIITEIHPSLGMPTLFALTICIYACYKKTFLNNVAINQWLFALLAVFAIAFFCVWSPIKFWHWLPQPLTVLQYTWRLLSQVSWISALLFAWAFCWLIKNDLEKVGIIASIILITITSLAWLPVPERYMHTFSQMLKNPVLILYPDSYLLNTDKATSLQHHVDNIWLNSPANTSNVMNILYDTPSNPNNKAPYLLKINTPYTISYTTLKKALHPYLVVEGYSPTKVSSAQKIFVQLNNQTVATKTFQSGKFKWIIPIDLSTLQPDNKKNIKLQFHTTPKITVPINYIIMKGFLNSNEVLDAEAVKPFCQQQKNKTICTLTVPPQIKLLELPIFYYPHLLSIKINNKPVSYTSVLYQNNLIAAVTPDAAQQNKIEIEFRGLKWANWVSLCMVLLVILGLSYESMMLNILKYFPAHH